jgi:nitrite reductase/ring-hydroxylating ferredoxin subunit
MTIGDERCEFDLGSVEDERGDVGSSLTAYAVVHLGYPRAWYCIAWSGEIRAGRVIPHRILERDLVLWRDRTGRLHCQAAHCPHLGSHLGYGGEVDGDSLKCPLHGWRFDGDGKVCGQPGPDRIREGARLANYRVTERYGAVFLWNGNGEPDIELPDVSQELGLDGRDIEFGRHRWFLPFPARWFAENVADGMHFAILHDAGGYGETAILDEAPGVLELENVVHDKRNWFGWQNINRRYLRGELVNLLTPVVGDIRVTCYGGPLVLARFSGRSTILGSNVAGVTPIDENSCYFINIPLMPRFRIPVVGGVMQRILNIAMALGGWSTVMQDAAIMMHRNEEPSPPYGPRDRGLITYRRFWDARIGAEAPLEGDRVRSYGARAGIRARRPDGLQGRSVRTFQEAP